MGFLGFGKKTNAQKKEQLVREKKELADQSEPVRQLRTRQELIAADKRRQLDNLRQKLDANPVQKSLQTEAQLDALYNQVKECDDLLSDYDSQILAFDKKIKKKQNQISELDKIK
ncbi:hypothetical protein JW756_02615 [Candidatus Woesearchaeota archaeon]|nr:hypothetical protein [Candidatus Woesearchaeota archaeon]